MSKEIYVQQPLTSQRIMKILDENPDLETISCPPSLYQRIASKYLEALENLGVEVKPKKNVGRPKKFADEEINKVNFYIKQGKTPQEVAEILGLPLKSVYYLKSHTLNRGAKTKYNKETLLQMKKMKTQGKTAKEISLQLNIPLRTVYALLKR